MLLFVSVIVIIICFTVSSNTYLQIAEGRTEELFDKTNNNLRISMDSPDHWNSGIISETISKLNWRLNGINAINDDASAFFSIINLPSLSNFALPLVQKTGLFSLFLSQYVTINDEYDITLSDGSVSHVYSISITADQFHNLNIPIDKGYDTILMTTKQGDITYIIVYATHSGRMFEFENIFQNILHSVRFGSVSLYNNN